MIRDFVREKNVLRMCFGEFLIKKLHLLQIVFGASVSAAELFFAPFRRPIRDHVLGYNLSPVAKNIAQLK
jgi:hypothetical protein